MSQGFIRKYFYACITVLLLAACTSGGGDGGNGDTTAPTATVSITPASSIPDSSLIPEDTVITITFSESMDTTSLAISGDMGGESDGGSWSQTSAMNDTLTISPMASWSAHPGRLLTIEANDLAGNPLATLNLAYHVYRGTVYYVSYDTGDDSYSGTSPLLPFRNIHTAVATAGPAATILVAQGTYNVNYTPTDTRIWLRQDIALYGGYSTDFTARDPVLNKTSILDTSVLTGTSANPNFAVMADNNYAQTVDGAGSSITSTTVVDGFWISGYTGASDAYTTGVRLRNGAAPRLSNNIIYGGNGTSFTAGIFNISSSPTIAANRIYGGISVGGNGYSIYASESSPDIVNNMLAGGTDSNNSTVGIYLFNSSPLVRNNSIYSGGGSSEATGIALVGYNYYSNPNIDNNIIFTRSGAGSTCVSETVSSGLATPKSMHNNDLYNCDVVYVDYENGCSGTCNLSGLNALTDFTEGGGNNISVDPHFFDLDGTDNDPNSLYDNDWHPIQLPSGGVTASGLNGNDEGWSFNNDNDGMIRPASGNPWTIGAYQPVAFNHARDASKFSCETAGCHDGATPSVTGKSLDHADTTDVCAACHVASTWVPTITPFDHGQVITTVCADCHDGSKPNITTRSLTHPGTTDVCEACHTTSTWTTYVIPIDHNQVVTTVCTDCHDGSIASGKHGVHIPTSEDCDTCHTTDAWIPTI